MEVILGHASAALSLGLLTYPVTLQRCNYWGELREGEYPVRFDNIVDLTAFVKRMDKDEKDKAPWLLRSA